MKAVFIEIDRDSATEYAVHDTLAHYASISTIDSYFIRQSSKIGPGGPGKLDFGRDFSEGRKGRGRRVAEIIGKMPISARRAASIVAEIDPDVIYSSQRRLDVYLGQIIGGLLDVPHIVHLHYTLGPWLGRFTLRRIVACERLIAVSEFIRQNALLQGAEPSRVWTVPNTIPLTEHLGPATMCSGVRERFGISLESPVVVSVGRLDPGKGHEHVIDAFRRVVDEWPESVLLICGTDSQGGSYRKRLIDKVALNQLGESVIFAGYQSPIGPILSCADIFCMATELEPFGLVFLEAMAASLPIVACRSGATPEIVVDGMTGLLSAPGDTHAMASNLLRLLRDPGMRKRLGLAARERLLSTYSPQTIIPRWERTVDALVSGEDLYEKGY